MGNQAILVAAMAGWFGLVMMPLPVESVQENWVEQIAHHMQEQKRLTNHQALKSAYERYLTQLQFVQQALAHGNQHVVQNEMGHLIRMLATKEGGISDSSARFLLYYVGEVTPVEYLDEATRDHLRLIKEMFSFRAEAIEEPPIDSGYNSTVTPRTAPWGLWKLGWLGNGTFNPIITLGAGVLLLVAVGASVLLLVGLGVGSTKSGGTIRTKEAESELVEKKTEPAGPRQDAA